MAVYLLPPGHKGRMQIFIVLAGVVGDHAAIGHHDLQVGCVHPDTAQQVALPFCNNLGTDVEDVAIHFVYLLLAHVLYVVLAYLLGGEDERIAVLDILQIGRGHGDALQGVFGGEDHLLSAPAGGVEDHVVHLIPFAVDLVVVVDGLHAGKAAVGIVVQRLAELALLGSELANNLLRGDRRLREIHAAKAGVERHGRKAVLVLPSCDQGAAGRQQHNDQPFSAHFDLPCREGGVFPRRVSLEKHTAGERTLPGPTTLDA